MFVAAILVLSGVGSAAAACFGPCPVLASPADEPLTFGVAFTARVTEVSDEPGVFGYDWRVSIDVRDVYRGDVPARITWLGWRHLSAVPLYPERLHVGDLVFIAAGYRERSRPINPFTPDVIVWHRETTGWSFYGRVLPESRDRTYYPAAARSANSLADILAVVRAAGLPDTAGVVPPPVPVTPDSTLPLLLSAVVGHFIGVRRVGRIVPA